MQNNIKKNILLVGASQMAVDYFNVLNKLECNITVVGRSIESSDYFYKATKFKVITGGIESFLESNIKKFDAVIVAVGIEQLTATTIQLIKKGFNYILVEKPAGLNSFEISNLYDYIKKTDAEIFVAYNRRFYASVLKAKEIINNDGGVMSFNFEFTEWAHTIEPLDKKQGIKENWLLANSSHVIDLAFYLGGKPKTINCYSNGKLSWHDKAIFAGAGKTENNVLFSYHANWNAPGRWGVEILTKDSRLILRPMEELHIQKKGSVAITKVQLNDDMEKLFKPGLFEQTKSFLIGKTSEIITLKEQLNMLEIYSMIAKGNV